MKNRILEHHLVRYVLAGVLSYAIELSFLLILYKVFGLSAELSTAIAFWVGLAASFTLQKIFAFRDYQTTVKAISRQLGTYVVLVALNYIFTLAVVALFPSKMVIFSRTVALILVTAWNYIIYKKYIFYPEGGKPLISKQLFASFYVKHKQHLLLLLLLSLPILTFFYQYLFTGGKSYGGDFDYYSQTYEAMRISILKFHQFPLWNPWLAGGIPLFANPQFGLFSIQTLLVLPFGAIYGLKLAFVIYALIGFWGMYLLGRRLFAASKFRSALIGYIWVFSGFFASHGIWHFTFTSFFFLPWVVYFIAAKRRRFSWLWLGLSFSIILLSSFHYAVLMLGFTMPIFFLALLSTLRIDGKGIRFGFNLAREDLIFIAKTLLVIIVLAGYQFLLTYHFESHNQRLTNDLSELAPSFSVLFQALFVPLGSIIKHYPKTSWGWGEYSMFIGVGTGLALLYCGALMAYSLVKRRKVVWFYNRRVMVAVLIVGLIGFALALGDVSKYSPFHLLHYLPGFTQTRVPSRWDIFAVFAILVFLLAWRPKEKLINFLLLTSVIELFIAYGPTLLRNSWYQMPAANFASSFSQYDNHHHHLGVAIVNPKNPKDKPIDNSIMDSYYYTTSRNIGQIYSDDSLINTLSASPPLLTDRCGQNFIIACTFVLSHNAKVTYWSPNKITLQRTKPGPINLNMNVESGWRINDTYPFAGMQSLQPSVPFILPGGSNQYTLQYAPKLSPSWLVWRLKKL